MDLIDVGGAQMMPSVNQIEVQPWWHEDVRVNTLLPVFINMIARHWEEASLSQSRVPSYPSVFFSFFFPQDLFAVNKKLGIVSQGYSPLGTPDFEKECVIYS